jgi:hypothetical protein
MKTALILASLIGHQAIGQQPPPSTVRAPLQDPAIRAAARQGQLQSESEAEAGLPHYNLDFPGGSPSKLVAAIEKAQSKPLNVIISPEDDRVELPPLKMVKVTTPSLFKALEQATTRSVNVIVGTSFDFGGNSRAQYQAMRISCTFRSDNSFSEGAIWYFHNERPPTPPDQQKTLHYYRLSDVLDSYPLDDVTSAIKKGLEMVGHDSISMNFHKQTKLLIAAGSPEELKVIDNVLEALGHPTKESARPPTPPPLNPSTKK